MNIIYKSILLLSLCNSLQPQFYAKAKSVLTHSTVKKDSIVQQETAIIDGTRYTAIDVLKPNFGFNFYIKNKNGKIVYTANEDEGIVDFKFLDFNGDGYKDLILDLMVADSGEQNLIVYDPKTKKFVLAGNCSNAKKIPNTKYFYSYQDCCMGREWSSELFYISNSRIKNIGHIKYSDGYGLFFFKLKGKRKILVKKWFVRINGDTPVTTGPHIDFDLGDYWRKHWHNFVK